MQHELLPTILLYLVALCLLSNSLDNLGNNHLYQCQNMMLLHRLSFLLGILFLLMKDSCVSPESCVISHVPIRAAMFSRFVTRHSEGSIQYDSVDFPYHSRKHLLRILIPPLALQSLHPDYFQPLAYTLASLDILLHSLPSICSENFHVNNSI